MNQAQTMNGRYYRTCMDDIKASEGWFGKICLLGLISFIPVFGQMTVYGYAYEWAHKAAWGVKSPLPQKIYSRPGSKMLRWGWFVLVIAVVFAILPTIVSEIGTALNNAGTPETLYTGYGYRVSGAGNAGLIALGGVISLIGAVFMLFVHILSWPAKIRMTIYDRLGAGFQLGTVWKMAKRDFGGLMRILGMELIWGIVVGLIVFIVFFAFFIMAFGFAFLPIFSSGGPGGATSNTYIGYVFTALGALLPLMLVLMYFAFVAEALICLLVARAVGYWAYQFDVASWGPQNEPLPFERQAAQQTQYQAPQQPVYPAPEQTVQSQTPDAPSGGDPAAVPHVCHSEERGDEESPTSQ